MRKNNSYCIWPLQNGGRLAARKRDLFPELSDDEIAALERACED